MSVQAESLARRYRAIRPHLTERQRRLWLGAEARELGSGGPGVVARAVGVAADTVRRGRAELDDPATWPVGASRRPGGGRKRTEVRDPEVVAALERLIDPEVRGDPMSPLWWTSTSTRTLAAMLREAGHQVSEFVVRRLLKQLGYRLPGNATTSRARQHPDGAAQFRYLTDQLRAHQDEGAPVIGVDIRKKELTGQTIPAEVDDLAAATGWVEMKAEHDTAAFAVATIARWWCAVGRAAYPDAAKLLIIANWGESDDYWSRQWRAELAALATRACLKITVCRLPPGISKWNTTEHWLFSRFSLNWRGQPLISHEVIVETIGTTAPTVLSVHAELDQTSYPTRITIPDQEIRTLQDNGTGVETPAGGRHGSNPMVHPRYHASCHARGGDLLPPGTVQPRCGGSA
jgi:Rhodopirellula transposase DDE domain